MPRRITARDRLRYRFDNLMARGPIALIGWLFVVSAVVVTALAGVDHREPPRRPGIVVLTGD